MLLIINITRKYDKGKIMQILIEYLPRNGTWQRVVVYFSSVPYETESWDFGPLYKIYFLPMNHSESGSLINKWLLYGIN